MWNLILKKFGIAIKERALIFVIEVLQDFVADVRRNGLDDRKRQTFTEEKETFGAPEDIREQLKNKL